MKKILLSVVLLLCTSNCWQAFSAQADSLVVQRDPHRETMHGIDANFAPMMNHSLFRWRYHCRPIDVYPFFHSKGINYFRLRIFVKDNDIDSLPYAVNTAKLVQAQGMNCSVTLFMSSDWVDISKQVEPASWDTLYDFKNLSMAHKQGVVRNYTRNTTRILLENGIDADLYEIGNEIDYGFCGFFETNTTRREDYRWMGNSTWILAASLINGAIEGVQAVDPSSSFILHIAHWWDANFSTAFFRIMRDNGVPVDFLGLSFYPSSGIYNITLAYQGIGNGTLSQLKFRQTTEALFNALHRQIIVSEYAYPSTSLILGPFSSFNHPVDGFPLTKQGQKAWLQDFLGWTQNHSFIAGTFYFSPEFHRIIWGPFSLFSYLGNAKPAIDVFEESR